MIFGLLEYIDNYYLFISLSIIVRVCEGFGSAIASTLVYSITASLCDENNLNIMIGYMELSYSIGLSIGPLFASLFYYLGGYAFTFLVCGSLNFMCLPFISSIKITEEKYESPGYWRIIFNYVILMN